ncbi:hypothetical protein AB9P05_15745 [Roseivirga sp. BDSF3-8]|uniref:hypothetical protein n=1 Tax=Roseivirga sp. BDSF3-8 TaxID=3241598 RepID=UPI003531D7CA
MHKLKYILPALYAGLLFLGYIHYFAYFAFFDINIAGYLSATDILFPFIPALPAIFVVVLVITLLLTGTLLRAGNMYDTRRRPSLFWLANHGKVIYQRLSNRYNAYSSIADLPGLLRYALLYVISFLLLIYQVAFVLVIVLHWSGFFTGIGYGTFMAMFIAWIFIVYEKARRMVRIKDIKVRLLAITLFMVTYAAASVLLSARFRARQMLIGTERISLITTDQGLYESSGGYRYIGQSGRFIFLRDTKRQANIILPKRHVASITLTPG